MTGSPAGDAPVPAAPIGLSVVAPVYNEAAILAELASRCAAAAAAVDGRWEVLLVDDCSTDATREIALAFAADPALVGIRVLHLDRNRGQFGATRAGLAAARGETVVVLDGDLQDPPELIPALVERLRASNAVDVVFATKLRRDDPLWFRVGRWGYAALLAIPGARVVPPGAGAYSAMTASVAGRVARLGLPDANLAPVLVALGVRFDTVRYEKVARYDGVSRVGPLGLIVEAIPSFALTGALTAWARASGVVLGGAALGFGSRSLAVAALVSFVLGEWVGARARAALRAAQTTATPGDHR